MATGEITAVRHWQIGNEKGNILTIRNPSLILKWLRNVLFQMNIDPEYAQIKCNNV